MWLWFVAGFAYVIIGLFNSLSAKRLRRIAIPSLERYRLTILAEEQKQISEREFLIANELFEKGEISCGELQIPLENAKRAYKAVGETKAMETLNKAFDNIESVANEFNKATDLNRDVLYAAAVSLFIAAAISFAQGLSLM